MKVDMQRHRSFTRVISRSFTRSRSKLRNNEENEEIVGHQVAWNGEEILAHEDTAGEVRQPVDNTSNEGVITPSYIAQTFKEIMYKDEDLEEDYSFSSDDAEPDDGNYGESMCLCSWDGGDTLLHESPDWAEQGDFDDTRDDSNSLVVDEISREEGDEIHPEAGDGVWRNTAEGPQGSLDKTKLYGFMNYFRPPGCDCFEGCIGNNKLGDNPEVLTNADEDDSSILTSPSLLLARMIQENDGHQRNIIRRYERDEEAASLTSPSMFRERLVPHEAGNNETIDETCKQSSSDANDVSPVSLLTSTLDDAFIFLNGYSKACCEHCRQPFDFAETRIADFCGTRTSNVRGLFHPHCRLVRNEIKKQKKLVLRQISLFGYLKRERLLQARRTRNTTRQLALEKQRQRQGIQEVRLAHHEVEGKALNKWFPNMKKSHDAAISSKEKSRRHQAKDLQPSRTAQIHRRPDATNGARRVNSRSKSPVKSQPNTQPLQLSTRSERVKSNQSLLERFSVRTQNRQAESQPLLSIPKSPPKRIRRQGSSPEQSAHIQDISLGGNAKPFEMRAKEHRPSTKFPSKTQSQRDQVKMGQRKPISSNVKALSSDAEALDMPISMSARQGGQGTRRRTTSPNRNAQRYRRSASPSRKPCAPKKSTKSTTHSMGGFLQRARR